MVIFFGRSVLFKRRQKEYYSEVNLKANEIESDEKLFSKKLSKTFGKIKIKVLSLQPQTGRKAQQKRIRVIKITKIH